MYTYICIYTCAVIVIIHNNNNHSNDNNNNNVTTPEQPRAAAETPACTAAFPARDRATAGTCSIMPPSFLDHRKSLPPDSPKPRRAFLKKLALSLKSNQDSEAWM